MPLALPAVQPSSSTRSARNCAPSTGLVCSTPMPKHPTRTVRRPPHPTDNGSDTMTSRASPSKYRSSRFRTATHRSSLRGILGVVRQGVESRRRDALVARSGRLHGDILRTGTVSHCPSRTRQSVRNGESRRADLLAVDENANEATCHGPLPAAVNIAETTVDIDVHVGCQREECRCRQE